MDQNVHIIAPDRGSGESYTSGVRETLEAPQRVTMDLCIIPPRVEGGHLTTNIEQVSHDLAQTIVRASELGATVVSIACNTLSLSVFVDHALELAKPRLEEEGLVMPELVLTVQEIASYFERNPDKHIVILGTKPLSEILSADRHYQTLVREGTETQPDLDLVQEIIWRVKAMQGSDTSSAPSYAEPLQEQEENRNALLSRLQTLNERLKELGIDEVIMGCTELPDAFRFLKDSLSEQLSYELVDPATLVGRALRQRMSIAERN